MKYYIWQNEYVGSIEVSELEYNIAINNCFRHALRYEHEVKDCPHYTSVDDTFYDKDDKIVCCAAAIRDKENWKDKE